MIVASMIVALSSRYFDFDFRKMNTDQTARDFQARNLLGTAEILIGFAAKESPFAEATELLETIKRVRARLKPPPPSPPK